MGVEYELKFRATPEQQEQLRKSVSGVEQEFAMETTYYDTPSGALSARHYTLRQRKENGVSVCTLKMPGKGQGRQEFEVNREDIRSAIPVLCKLSEEDTLLSLLSEGIEPVCGARFTRIAKTVVLPDSTLELALDRGVLAGGGREQPLCEVEVELKQGREADADGYAALLTERFGLVPEPLSKFRRAQMLAMMKGEA